MFAFETSTSGRSRRLPSPSFEIDQLADSIGSYWQGKKCFGNNLNKWANYFYATIVPNRMQSIRHTICFISIEMRSPRVARVDLFHSLSPVVDISFICYSALILINQTFIYLTFVYFYVFVWASPLCARSRVSFSSPPIYAVAIGPRGPMLGLGCTMFEMRAEKGTQSFAASPPVSGQIEMVRKPTNGIGTLAQANTRQLVRIQRRPIRRNAKNISFFVNIATKLKCVKAQTNITIFMRAFTVHVTPLHLKPLHLSFGMIGMSCAWASLRVSRTAMKICEFAEIFKYRST